MLPMQTMISRTILALGFALLIVGCSRPPGPGKGSSTSKSSTPEDSVRTALEALSRADTLANIKEAGHLLNKHLSKLESRDVIQLSKENRQALTSFFGLDKEELEVVEARTFRPLDAHHLQMCFLLRDASRMLDQPGLDPLEQARMALAWVDRQVLLRESSGPLVPPYYVLRAGQGNTRERALVFLALLQQFRIPACVLQWPDEDGKQGLLLVGVLITRGEQTDIFLFDPRLGQPISGPGPDGIATLARWRKDPKLLPLAKGKNASRPEILLAAGLSAFSPRMKYLEENLARSERIVLALEPAQLMKQIKAAAGEVQVCEPSLRVLPKFLPRAEGGTDKNGRLGIFEAHRIPILPAAHRLAAMKLLGEDLPVNRARLNLINFSQQLFVLYAREPQELLLKGQLDKAIKRLQIMRSALDDLEFSPLPDFNQRVSLWRDEVIRRFLALIRQQPGAKEAVEALWSRDQYLVALLQGENPDPQKHTKEELTYIILTAVKSSLGEHTLYLLASAWQEKAERYQATWERLKNTPKAEIRVGRAAENAHEAWSTVCGWWKKYEELHPLAWSGLESRFAAIQARWQARKQEEALSLWDLFFSEIHRAAAARLFLARTYQNLGRTKDAINSLVKLDEQLTALLDNAEINNELASALEKVRGEGNPIQAAILENLARDLGQDGGFYWLRERTRAQLQQLKNGK